jgi:hypothetical protein
MTRIDPSRHFQRIVCCAAQHSPLGPGGVIAVWGRPMRRREFIGLVGGAAVTWPLVVLAQQPQRMRRIGVLIGYSSTDPEGQARTTAFVQGLGARNWYEGSNLRIDWGGAATTRSSNATRRNWYRSALRRLWLGAARRW